MDTIKPQDRAAAKRLREELADVSGFWHNVDDDSALCQAFARYRLAAEKTAAEQHSRGALIAAPISTGRSHANNNRLPSSHVSQVSA